MSITVTPEQVSSVLLDDGWHEAENFVVGPSPWGDEILWYEFTDVSGVTEGRRLAGPTSSIIRVSISSQSSKPKVKLPEWCGACRDSILALRIIKKGGQTLPCPSCHPDPDGWNEREAARQEQREWLHKFGLKRPADSP
ncbi:hypothetical protein ACIGD1_34705 [Streptomyces sp. NPDC085612]|uniref:hypothetical protein n=1 Tax=Streptomyces sp. NPDC085612 TaxID=3365732 RepID=UPI0037D8B1E0